MELPLFPLNSVLFPGMPIRLHIFEQRYREMINECIDDNKPFGIVLIEQGTAELGPVARPRMIGTTAHITNVQRFPDGRLNILAIGRERFKINTLDYNARSFLMSDVDMMPLEADSESSMRKRIRQLLPLLERYLDALADAGETEIDISQLPDDPMSVGFLAAVLLQSDEGQKQALLEADGARELFKRLLSIYQREVALINILLSPPDDLDTQSPFSIN